MSLQINDLVVESTLSASTLTATTLFVGTNSVGGTLSNFNSLSSTTLSAGTIYSGNTDLYNIFLTTNDGNDITRVQPGSNIITGGTNNFPVINLVVSPSVNNITFSGSAIGGNVQAAAGTFTSLSAATLSGGTIFSGGTNLYSIFQKIGDVDGVANVNAGSNITTGGTSTSPTISIVASPSFNALILSGNGQFAAVTATSLSAATLSGGTILSGNTNLQNSFNAINSQLFTKANLSGATFTGQINTSSLSATTLSGGTILSGGTNLYSIFQKIGDVDGVANVNAGTNITTGGTAASPIINLVASPSVNNITFSGSAIGGNVQAAAGTFTSLSATTLSGGTILSGGTNLYSIFATNTSITPTYVQNGLNTYTGGTPTNPTVNISAATLSTISVSGATSLGVISATTIISGSTNLSDLFHLKNGYKLQKAGNISGASFAGNPKKYTLTFVTPFADTNYAISISSDTNRTWTWESKTASGFTISSNSNTAFNSGNVNWIAQENGEGYI